MLSAITAPTPLILLSATTSTLVSGAIASLTLIAIPALLTPSPSPTTSAADADAHLVVQWARLFHLGIRVAPPLAICSALCSWVCAYRFHDPAGDDGAQVIRLVGAGLLTAGMVPYTMVVMERTNAELWRREGLVRAGGKKDGQVALVKGDGMRGLRGRDSRALVRSWAVMNLGRAVLVFAGALMALSAL